MHLSHFPSSVLAQILSYEDISFMIFTLLKAGDSILSSKLVSSLTYVSLRSAKSSPKTLPSLLFQLPHLRDVELYSDSNILDRLFDWHLNLQKLPRDLQSLKISSSDAFSAIMNYAPESTGMSLNRISTQYPRGKSCLIDLGTLFPQLHTLKLLNFEEEISPADLAALPSTLTSLTLPEVYINATSISYLPESLTCIDATVILTGEEAGSEGSKPVPQGLKYIRDVWYDTNSMESCFDWLPETTEIGRFVSQTWDPLLAHVVHFPIHTLHFPNTGAVNSFDDTLQLLPSTLKALYLGLGGNAQFGDQLCKLPSSLDSIEMLGTIDIHWSDIRAYNKAELAKNRAFSFWPSTLKTLWLPDSQIAVSDLDLLPKTLQSLKILLMRELKQSPADSLIIKANKFPSSLTDLHIFMKRSKGKFQIISRFSSKLQKLTIGDEETPLVTDRQTIESTLPSSLKALSLPAVHLENMLPNPSTPIQYPSQLTRLRIFEMATSGFIALPRSLTFLDLFWLLTESESTDIYESLPPGLRTLKIVALRNDENVPYSESCFSKLRHLEHLACGGSYPSGVVKSLAPSLTSLSLSLKNLTQEDLLLLPRRLVKISIGTNIQWSDLNDVAAHWPPNARDDLPRGQR